MQQGQSTSTFHLAAPAAAPTLLTMAKPDSVQRVCSAEDTRRVWETWGDVVAWLRGADHEQLPHRDVVRQVAQVAGLRSVRLDQYDIRRWASQAQSMAMPDLPGAAAQPLPDLLDDVIRTLGFTPAAPAFHGMLTPDAIEAMYADTPVFYASPDGRNLVTPALLQGLVRLTYWTGDRCDLALAVKFVIREVLTSEHATDGTPSSRTRNLVHIDCVTDTRRHRLDVTLAQPAQPDCRRQPSLHGVLAVKDLGQ